MNAQQETGQHAGIAIAMNHDWPPDTIHTHGTVLRRPTATDAPSLFREYTQDPQVCRYMVWTPHRSQEATREFIRSCMDAWVSRTRFAYVLAREAQGPAVGMIEARPLGSTVDIGYVLARSQWGQGLMPEAIRSLAKAALAQESVFRVQATCDCENQASQRAVEKAGFSREGRLERHTVHPNIAAEPRACFMYALCR